MPAVIWPDVQAFLLGFLSSALPGRDEPFAANVAVRGDAPSEQPGDPWPVSGRLVTVRDDGGPALGDVRAAARVGVNVWATTDADAADLAALVVALVASTEGTGPVRRAAVTRAYEVPDGRPHRYFTAELTIKGVGL